MKLLMDSDCLTKLVKSSLKETVCAGFSVEIPLLVKKEVVDNSGDEPDAEVIKTNVEKNRIRVSTPRHSKGEEAVFTVFQSGGYDAICSDDKRFIKRLRLFEIPYLTPAVLIAVLLKKKKITLQQAFQKLDSLGPMISEEEYSTVKAFLSNWRENEN
jgi:hypothetical protein